MIFGRGLARTLEAVREEADRIVVLRMNHHECAGLAGRREHLE